MKKDRDIHKSIFLILYILCIGSLSIFMFLYGFFPITNYDSNISSMDDIPQHVENISVKREVLYQPTVKKLIIMVIDALRWDFIVGPMGKIGMPTTSSLLVNHSACLMKTIVQSPTVTMPRIKAITTGTVPGFIDVAMNLGSTSINGDNILIQANKQGHKIVFYGDETWLKLFPKTFHRYEGTTSFFATDFYEVDINVTRHIHKELEQNDWTILILHYLGLDHIGHVAGPYSPLIKPKLKEMDMVIEEIYAKVSYWNQHNNPTLFIITGDHGMKDSGSHGGSTISETTVPLITIGTQCLQKNFVDSYLTQIDITSTLSVLLGIPIPFSNLGTVNLNLMEEFPISKKLFVLYYNAKQVFRNFEKLPNFKSHYAFKQYLNAVELHVKWLNSTDASDSIARNILKTYEDALYGMREILISSMTKYDTYLLIISIIILCHLLCIIFNGQNNSTCSIPKLIFLFTIHIFILAVTYNYCNSEISTTNTTVLKILMTVIIIFINCYFLAKIKYSTLFIFKLVKSDFEFQIFSFFVVTQIVSLSSSSFVEEEHQTWYFFWVTLVIVFFYNCIRTLEKLYTISYRQLLCLQTCIKLLLLLIGHRILRKLNSTGDKYAHLPDISGWLTKQNSKFGATALLIIGLLLLIWISFQMEDDKHKYIFLLFHISIAICIYLRHMCNNNVIKIPYYPVSRGIKEVKIFWMVVLTIFACRIYQLMLINKYKHLKVIEKLLFFIIQLWVIVSAMLHQSYNGNSNSLATIDTGAGYIGLEMYKPLTIAVYLIVNTYSAPVLAYLTFIYYETLKQDMISERIVANIKYYLTWRLLTMTIYAIIISIQRWHIFVWTVFAPKLLYEVMFTSVLCCLFISTLVILLFHNILLKPNR
ncbi:GPI ethanolamine phosphate transferase 2 isoform X2 [Prorops nasuta]|uniref:GPI ethanolamine phosphate transferase 2 isoform X2 n=1 Tax=Prorops nasuta TaxID=863751 RepID=UPI0034CDF762